MPEDCLVEMKHNKIEVVHGLLTTVDSPSIDKVMNCEDFSSLRHLLAITAHVIKFGQIVQQKAILHDTDYKNQAETLWIGASQQTIKSDKNFPQWKRQFVLFQDDASLWRCRGRLQNADAPISTIHPILLNKNHHLTTLLIRRAHERVMHCGVKATLTELRSRFWIVRGRSTVQKILSQCVVCKRLEGKSYHTPIAPPLPSFRVVESHPFTHTGVDFAGPLYIGSLNNKAWICLYTCCVTRAVHLELVSDLSTETFIRCMKRFTSRRGLPTRMVSDNGKTFKGAAKEIRSIFTHQDVQNHTSSLGIKFEFNLPKAPWWGGLFERLIKSVKRCLRKIIGQARLNYDEMTTALVEVEAVLNSRPLTYVTTDDMDEPLTPSHLLTGHRILSLPDNPKLNEEEEDEEFNLIERKQLTRRARHLNRTLNTFWTRWRQEYLLELREAHRYHPGSPNVVPIKVGDVVVVHSSEQPRAFWKLGRVVEVVRGRDGQIRGAKLRVSGKGRQATTLHRPIQRLFPLETSETEARDPSEPVVSAPSETDAHDPSEADAHDPSEADAYDPSETDAGDLSETDARDLSETDARDPSGTESPNLSGTDTHDLSSIEGVDQPISDIMNNCPILRRPSRIAAQVARDRLLAQTLMDN